MQRFKILFFIVFFLLIATRCGSIDGLEVIEATYGGNCNNANSQIYVAPGNITSVIVTDCDHRKGSCTFDFTLAKLKKIGGDPAVGCAKDLLVSYKCSRDRELNTAKLDGEALYKKIKLQCPPK